MTDIIVRLSAAIHLESAAIAPQTSALIEAAREAISEIERLRRLTAAADAGSFSRQAVNRQLVPEADTDAISDGSN